MRDIFNTYNDFFGSECYKKLWNRKQNKNDRVFKSTRLEDEIYKDLSKGDSELETICKDASSLLSTFDSLARDVFTGFYSLSPKQRGDEEISATSRRVNKPIIEKTIADDEFVALKNVCEGRELPAYDASVEFSEKIAENLPELMESLKDTKTLETLDKQTEQLKEKLRDLCAENEVKPDEKREQKITQTANRLHKKEQQINDLEKKSADALIKAAPKMNEAVKQAVQAAKEKAEETDDLIHAWGNDPGDPQSVKANEEVLSKVRRNPKLLEISRIMGRYIKMIAEKRKNSFEYGLGQKYDISLGKNLNLCLSSEMALLGTPETQPLFMKKYIEGKLKQYRKREPEVKGQGDIIVCVDESLSMNDNNYILWAKALAFALLDIATKGKRKFAMVRFCERTETHLFLPNEYTSQDLITAIEGFMRGGTNFEKPLAEACRLINEGNFENADVIFITDGICTISNEFAEYFKQQKAGGFNVRGILLGDDAEGSLERFCDKVYRLSDLGLDEIAKQVISDKI
ncbi:MAG: VWA domain-containing protein [Oscillospiraceae bacterium]|jgi:uncharacterized protein with von Willebrand factor type A (vWA) domain|nr:VWA domain-containing protein [Oscillospiraceae bacterium]